MKRLFKTSYKTLLLVIVSLLPSLLFTRCSKDKQPEVVDPDPPVTIVLYNKPLATIKQYAQGCWKYVYGVGGFSGGDIYKCDSCYIEITPDDKFIDRSLFHNDTLSIVWKKELGSHIATYDSTYVMYFYYPEYQMVTPHFIIDSIDHDTLVMHDYGSDPFFYRYIKSN